MDQLLGQHRHVIRALADALLDRNELIGDEIIDVITAAERAHGLPIEIDLTEGVPVIGPLSADESSVGVTDAIG